MSSLWHTPTAILWLLTWLASPPTSLGDAALRESIRRQATTKSAATLTNLGRELEPPPAAAVSGIPVPSSTTDPATGSAESKPATGEKAAGQQGTPADPPRDEKWWRTRISEARAMVDKDDLLIESLQSRINALQADSVNIDDPLQQNKARQQLSTTLAELDNMKKKREADLKAIATLQDDARRMNIPAGWVR